MTFNHLKICGLDLPAITLVSEALRSRFGLEISTKLLSSSKDLDDLEDESIAYCFVVSNPLKSPFDSKINSDSITPIEYVEAWNRVTNNQVLLESQHPSRFIIIRLESFLVKPEVVLFRLEKFVGLKSTNPNRSKTTKELKNCSGYEELIQRLSSVPDISFLPKILTQVDYRLMTQLGYINFLDKDPI